MDTNLKFIKNKVFSNKIKENEIFISRKRKNLEKFYYSRAHDLIFENNCKEIFVCGLGSCLNYAVSLALLIAENIPQVKIDKIETSSVNHVDDYINGDTGEVEIRKKDRFSNLIKIKIIKK